MKHLKSVSIAPAMLNIVTGLLVPRSDDNEHPKRTKDGKFPD